MKMSFVVAAFAAAVLAGCAGTPSGQTSAGPSVEAVPGAGVAGLSGPLAVANTADSGSEKEICKKVDPMTGSRVGGRTICLTKAQWDARAEASKQFTEDAQNNGKWKEGRPQ